MAGVIKSPVGYHTEGLEFVAGPLVLGATGELFEQIYFFLVILANFYLFY